MMLKSATFLVTFGLAIALSSNHASAGCSGRPGTPDKRDGGV